MKIPFRGPWRCVKLNFSRTIQNAGSRPLGESYDRSWPSTWMSRLYAAKTGRGIGPRQKWTAQQTALLSRLKQQDATKEELLANFPDRTWRALASKWSKIGDRDEGTGRLLHATGVRFFTSQELQTISRLRREGLSRTEIARQLPGRAPHQIGFLSHHALDGTYSYGRKPWTVDDRKRAIGLRDNHLWEWKDIAAEIGRTVQGVRSMYFYETAKVRDKKPPRRYSEEEDATIISMSDEGATVSQIHCVLPGRSETSINQRRFVLQQWMKRERPRVTRTDFKRFVSQIDNMRHQGMSWAGIAQHFPDRSVDYLQNALSRWRIRKRRAEEKVLGAEKREFDRTEPSG